MTDPVNHPKHYTSHPSGVEAIEITRWLRGPYSNACKYVMRGWEGLKGDPIEDLSKALWYLNDAEKFPDEARYMNGDALFACERYLVAETDEEKRLTIIYILEAAKGENPIRCDKIHVDLARSLIKLRITYLQSRPGVAL